MSSKNLTLDLKAKKDIDKKTFYIAKLQFPGYIDCSKGVAFLIFVSDQGEEQLQIAPMDKRDDSEE